MEFRKHCRMNPVARLGGMVLSILLTALFLTHITSSPVQAAAPGDLDLSFDTDGKVTTDFATSHDCAYAVAIQPADGKIVVGGSTGFCEGGNNKVTTYPNADVIQGIAIQWDGKLVAAGYSHNGSNYDFALVRYWLAPCP